MSTLLKLDDLAIRFGGVQAVAGVSLRVSAGELIGLIGPNGAGKTTLLRLVTGIAKPDSGRVLLDGHDVTQRSTAARVRMGLALTHQIVRPFRSLTVLENVALAAGHANTSNPWRALLHGDRSAAETRAESILATVGLAATERKPVTSLALGQLKRLEMARALALGPRVVLFDEPLAGLNSAEAVHQIDTIATLNANGLTVVLIEHNLAEVIRVCRRLIVLDAGKIIADGEPQAVMDEPAVREAYVGTGHAAA